MYDTKSKELAESFLADVESADRRPGDTHELAQVIQDAIESYLEDLRRKNAAEADDL